MSIFFYIWPGNCEWWHCVAFRKIVTISHTRYICSSWSFWSVPSMCYDKSHTHTQTCTSFLLFITVCIQALMSGHLKTQKFIFTVTLSIWNLLSHSSFGITLLFILTVTTQLVLHDFRRSQAWRIIIFIHPQVNCHCGVWGQKLSELVLLFLCVF